MTAGRGRHDEYSDGRIEKRRNEHQSNWEAQDYCTQFLFYSRQFGFSWNVYLIFIWQKDPSIIIRAASGLWQRENPFISAVHIGGFLRYW